MQVTFLGVGSAFTMQNFQSNMLVQLGGKNMLIDCGSDCRFSLKEQGLGHRDIDALYISHQHADHAGGIEWLAFSSYFDPACTRPVLYADESLLADLWPNTLSGGLRSIQGKITKLSTYFNVQPVLQNETFMFARQRFRTVQTIHVVDGYSFMLSFGLMWRRGKQRVFLTTDTQFCPHQIMDFYREATIIFQDCETTPFKSGVHAHISELATLPDDVKAKMWLYHYNDGPKPDARELGFAGYVEKGQSFQF